MKKNPTPFHTGFLPEKDGHQIFYAQYGNPKGETVVVLHGGPGSGSKPKQAKTYDLAKYQVVTFDQRGCGKSLPLGRIEANTLGDLIADLERLRSALKIETWFVAGGSWGSTLALVYAQTHPHQVRGLLLSSIFLARSRDEQWVFSKKGGVERLFPDLWEDRIKFLKKYKTSPIAAAQDLLLKINHTPLETVREIVAEVSNWEDNLMNAWEDLKFIDPEDVKEEEIAAVKIFLHYEANKFFLKENQLIRNLSKIASIPTIIVHGRYDVLCPVEATWEIQRKLNNVEVIILPTSNHRLTAEGEIARSLAFNFFLERQL